MLRKRHPPPIDAPPPGDPAPGRLGDPLPGHPGDPAHGLRQLRAGVIAGQPGAEPISLSELAPQHSGWQLRGMATPQPGAAARGALEQGELLSLAQGLRALPRGFVLQIAGGHHSFTYCLHAGQPHSGLDLLLQASFNRAELLEAPPPARPLQCAAYLLGTPAFAEGQGGAWTPGPYPLLGAIASAWRLTVRATPVAPDELVALAQALRDANYQILRRYLNIEQGRERRELDLKEYEHVYELMGKRLERALQLGGWRVWAALEGDAVTRSLLLAGLFGRGAPLQPLQAIPLPEGRPGPFPGTLLTGDELAVYLQPPRQEIPGFRMSRSVAFDTQVAGGDGGCRIGDVIGPRGHRTTQPFALGQQQLVRHGLVVGMTGSGKSTTCKQLLQQLSGLTSFLVIEAAKREYRHLPHSDLAVYTLGGRESPLQLNPFAFPQLEGAGIDVQMHIDYIKALFAASFVLYAPMPEVLEQCLYQIYEDAGWDLRTGRHLRAKAGDGRPLPPTAFPTLSDLYHKIRPVVARLGYDARIANDLRAALETRINSLRLGAKGQMLDCQVETPIPQLLGRPTVLELASVVSDDEKAFLIGLLLIQLYEYRLQQGDSRERLRGLLLIEEAHHLLRRSQVGPAEGARTGSQAIGVFINLLAEIRAYGQGILIADQLPSALTPEVVKSSNIKICHRLDEAEERALMAGAMAMSDEQRDYLGRLGVGQAAVFMGGEDGPLLVQVDRWPGHERSLQRQQLQPIIPLRQQPEALQRAAERLWQSAILGADPAREWQDWQGHEGRPIVLAQLLQERCREQRLPFDVSEELEQLLRGALIRLGKAPAGAQPQFDLLEPFRSAYHRHCPATRPYGACQRFCREPCLYRYEVTQAVFSLRLRQSIQAIEGRSVKDGSPRGKIIADAVKLSLLGALGKSHFEHLPEHHQYGLWRCAGIQVAELYLEWEDDGDMVASNCRKGTAADGVSPKGATP